MAQTALKPIVVFADRRGLTSSGDVVPCLQDSFPERRVKPLDADEFFRTLKENRAAIAVIPGIIGETSHYHELIGADGMKKLKKFVERGGLLLTICAGAYYVARETEYRPAWGPAKGRLNLWPLFNARASGPMRGIGHEPPGTSLLEDVTLADIFYKNANGQWKETKVAYGNGPALYPDDIRDDIEVLARYKQHGAEKPIAAAWKDIGQGAVMWLGVLPYVKPQPLAATAPAKLKNLVERLGQNEAGRDEFWTTLVNRLKSRLPAPGIP